MHQNCNFCQSWFCKNTKLVKCSFFLFKNLNVVVRLFQTWHWRMRANLDPLNHWMLWKFRHDGFLYIHITYYISTMRLKLFWIRIKIKISRDIYSFQNVSDLLFLSMHQPATNNKLPNIKRFFFCWLEIKPCGLGSRIRDVEVFWYKTEIKIIYFVPLCLIVSDCMVYPDPKLNIKKK